MRILIAEDDPINSVILEDILKGQGYEVVCVPDGLQALSELHRMTFDVLITDWMMPYLDGIGLIRTVRREVQMAPAILLITSATIPTVREHALDSGADDFVSKPFEPQEVLTAIQTCLARRQQFELPENAFSVAKLSIAERSVAQYPTPHYETLIQDVQAQAPTQTQKNLANPDIYRMKATGSEPVQPEVSTTEPMPIVETQNSEDANQQMNIWGLQTSEAQSDVIDMALRHLDPNFVAPVDIPTPKRRPPPFIGIGVSTNTGGPAALNRLFQEFPNTDQAVFLVILQAPVWALDMFAMRLQKMTLLKVVLADDGMQLAGGTIYIARKGRHLSVDPDTFRINLLDDPEENFARPSADVLFRSIEQAFGKYAVGVILTGIGQDGAMGAAHISAGGGNVIVQDPATAEAPFLPKSVSDMGITRQIIPLPKIAKNLAETVNAMFQSI